MLFGREYNPEDISKYFGKKFITEGGSEYSLSEGGIINGRKSIEGYKIELIAGLDEMGFLRSRYRLNSKENLDLLIKGEGKEPKKGLNLVISLTEESAIQSSRIGLVTGKIVSIKNKF